jgi:monovalent cation:H+ antiporter-2, CPA2 family
VLVGYGRVGAFLGQSLIEARERVVIIEAQPDRTSLPEPDDRVELVTGNAADPATLRRARLEDARLLFVAIPHAFEAGQIIEQARKANPAIRIVARAHSEDEITHLNRRGSDATIMGEHEVARRMTEEALTGI